MQPQAEASSSSHTLHGGAPRDGTDLKEYVEHIRRVHFTMMAICFAVLVGSILVARTDATRALDQLRRIEGSSSRSWHCLVPCARA
jgi:hypothetical protein